MKSIPVGNHGLTLELWETWEQTAARSEATARRLPDSRASF